MTKALHRLNTRIKLPQLQKIMMEFERETEIMDLKEEMMSDTIDDAIGEGDDEEETEAIVGQVLGKWEGTLCSWAGHPLCTHTLTRLAHTMVYSHVQAHTPVYV